MLLLISTQVSSIEGNEDLTSQERELYQQIIQEVRCLVCQNQDLSDSNASLAKDLKSLVN